MIKLLSAERFVKRWGASRQMWNHYYRGGGVTVADGEEIGDRLPTTVTAHGYDTGEDGCLGYQGNLEGIFDILGSGEAMVVKWW